MTSAVLNLTHRRLLWFGLGLSLWFTVTQIAKERLSVPIDLTYTLPVLLSAWGTVLYWKSKKVNFWQFLFGLSLAVGLAVTLIPVQFTALPIWLLQDTAYLTGFIALFFVLAQTDKNVAQCYISVVSWVVLIAGIFVYFVVIPAIFDQKVYASWLSSLFFYAVGDTCLLGFILYRGLRHFMSSNQLRGWLFITLGWWLSDMLALWHYFYGGEALAIAGGWLSVMPCAIYVWLAQLGTTPSKDTNGITPERNVAFVIVAHMLCLIFLHTLGYALDLLATTILAPRSVWLTILFTVYGYLFVRLRANATTTQPTRHNNNLDGQSAPTHPIEDIILKNMHNVDFNSKALANKLGVSERTLQRQCQEAFGLPPSALIKKLRLEEAAKLLTRGERPTVVAYRVGFNSSSYFSRSFRDYFGVPPSQYASAHQ